MWREGARIRLWTSKKGSFLESTNASIVSNWFLKVVRSQVVVVPCCSQESASLVGYILMIQSILNFGYTMFSAYLQTFLLIAKLALYIVKYRRKWYTSSAYSRPLVPNLNV